MTYLLSAAGFLINERNTWESRADSAWGASRNWPDGISWETDRNNWYNQANAWYTSRYNDGYSAGNTAGYNSGYAAADAAESPRALSSYAFTGTATANGNFNAVTISGAGAGGVLVNNGPSLTAVRPGYWVIFAQVGGYNNTGVKIFTEGVQRAVQDGNPNAPDFLAGVATHHIGFINASGSIQFQARAGSVCNLNMTVTFVPTPGYQQ